MRGRSDQRRTRNFNICTLSEGASCVLGERRPISIGLKDKPRQLGDMSQQCNKLQKDVNLQGHPEETPRGMISGSTPTHSEMTDLLVGIRSRHSLLTSKKSHQAHYKCSSLYPTCNPHLTAVHLTPIRHNTAIAIQQRLEEGLRANHAQRPQRVLRELSRPRRFQQPLR